METRQVRSVPGEFQTRNDDGKMSIEGYFAVFNRAAVIGCPYSTSNATPASDSS